MKAKRLLPILLLTLVLALSVSLLAACGHEHQYSKAITTEATCESKGLLTYTCACGESYTEETAALGHNLQTHQAQNANCNQVGWDAYETCTRCDYTTYAGEIPMQHNSNGTGTCLDCGLAESTPGLTYSQNEDGTYTVTGIGTCTETDIVIGFYNSKNVTSIGDDAFEGCNSFTSIVIPDSVTSIGNNAFKDCTSLTSITIPDSVTTIGISSFYNCDSLTSIVIPNSVTSIRGFAFAYCSNLTSIKVATDNPNYCSQDGNLYNKDKTKLIQYACGKTATTFTIPDSVTTIGDFAFSGCNLTSIAIPDSVTSIGGYAFEGCNSLTTIVIPNSVTSIGGYAFEYCTKLTGIVIPDSVTSIGRNAFYKCSSLTSVTIGNSVTSIGEYAFYDCDNLTSIVIPDSVTSIGRSAFYHCDNLTSIVIPNSVTSIGEYAFAYCYNLTIYCEATSKPGGWDSNWNYSNRPVVWGCKD